MNIQGKKVTTGLEILLIIMILNDASSHRISYNDKANLFLS